MKFSSICKKTVAGLATLAIVSGYMPAMSNTVMATTDEINQEVVEKKGIVFPDKELEKLLLQSYDSDKDGIITEEELLKVTDMNINSGITDLTGLEYAKNLHRLTINSNDIKDMSVINKLSNLKCLDLYGNSIKRINEITILNNLTRLSLTMNTDTKISETEYNIIGKLVNLKEFIVQGVFQDTPVELEPLKNLVNLEYLLINGRVSNPETISNFTKLTSLSVWSKDSITDIGFVRNLTNLKVLSLENNMISDITPVKDLMNLQNVNFLKNPINTKKVENAETLQALRDRNVNVSIVETNATENIQFKDENFKKAIVNSVDMNKDNQISIEEMERVISISITTSANISSIEELEYATNLQYFTSYANVADFTPLTKLPNLRSVTINNTNVSQENMNIIFGLNTLKELTIYDKYIDNIDVLSNMNSLERLTLNQYYIYNGSVKILDLQGIEKISTLKRLYLNGYVTNIGALKELPNLEELYLKDTVYNENGNLLTTKETIDYINELDIKNVKLTINKSIGIDLGKKLLGSEQKLNFSEISDVLEALCDPANKAYCEDLKLTTSSGFISIDNNAKQISISTENIGQRFTNINISSKKFSGNMTISWYNYVQGDTTKEINIPDENLKKVLLENHDFDGDKRITEHDLVNIIALDLECKDVSNLEGLQYARNMINIAAGYNNLSDISPIMNLENLYVVSLDHNLFTDISTFENVKWKKENLVFSIEKNFINFENENKNYQVLRNIIFAHTGNSDENKEANIRDIINRQNIGNVNDRNNIAIVDKNLKAVLIEKFKMDSNNDGEISRRELEWAGSYIANIDDLNLSNANITDISGLEYIDLYGLNLSNNNIKDITPITKNNHIYSVNLSNNQITDISGVTNCYSLYDLKLNNNKITDISSLAQNDFNNTYTVTIEMFDNNIDLTNAGNKAAKEVWDNKENRVLKLEAEPREEVTMKEAEEYEIVNAINNNQNVTLDMKEKVEDVSSNVFGTLADNRKAELKVETDNATWRFDSENITYKDIDLKPRVILSATRFENMSEPPSEDGIFIKFEHEGNLPGKAEIELNIKDYNVYGNNKTVYLYYFDSNKKEYQYISTVTTEDEKVKVVLEHCSEYVLLDKMLFELGDVNGDKKINARDAKLVLQYFNGNVELTEEQQARADVNGDGKINARDAKLILQKFNGNNSAF